MTYEEIYNQALKELKLDIKQIKDYKPAIRLYAPELRKDIPDGIIIWLKNGKKLIYSEPEKIKNYYIPKKTIRHLQGI